jgi:hypothetical protein
LIFSAFSFVVLILRLKIHEKFDCKDTDLEKHKKYRILGILQSSALRYLCLRICGRKLTSGDFSDTSGKARHADKNHHK